jgi:histidine triad (HIT) family protein
VSDCHICIKHTAMSIVPGGELIADEHAVVSHLPLTTPTECVASVHLGHLFVEPRRHVAGLGELTADEAASVERLSALAGAALQRSEGAERVDVATTEGDHLQVQVVARYADAPRGDALDVIALMDRLRAAV